MALEDSRIVPDGSIGLAYFDPPFATDRVFDAGLRRRRGTYSAKDASAFDDHWSEYRPQTSLPASLSEVVRICGLVAGKRIGGYVQFMAERIAPLAKKLSPTGSVYVHVSPDVSPYVRLILDAVLGPSSFRNEIVWKRTHAHSGSRRFGPVHDTILLYARDGYNWTRLTASIDPDYVEKHFRNVDEQGRRYQLVTCTGPGDRTGTEAHYRWRGKLPPPGRHWAWRKAEMERLDAEGLLRYSKTGTVRRVYFAHDHRGTPLQDVWTDIPRLDSHSGERVGYDTQKPAALLSRIVAASRPREGELVFDGFVGTGTTLVAAEAAGLPWVGVDVSLKATSLSVGRLAATGVTPGSIRWHGGPTTDADAFSLAERDGDTFGVWATGMLGMRPDHELSTANAIYAIHSGDRGVLRAVAAPALESSHLVRLREAKADARFVISTKFRGLRTETPIPLDRLVNASRGYAPVSPFEVAA